MKKDFIIMEAEAIKFVEEKHRPQEYGGFPYFVHLLNVADIAKDFGLSQDVILACWLHDVLEDTATSYNDVRKSFGEAVADMVYRVTDEKGRNRKEKHAKTYPQIYENENATLVKLCDRIANVRFGLVTLNYDKMGMYVKENDSFCAAVYNHNFEATKPLWDELEKLNNSAQALILNQQRAI